MFKAFLALFLSLFLTLNAHAQSVSAEGCMAIGQALYGEAVEKSQGKTLKEAVKEVQESLANTPNAVLIPYLNQKLVELYQSKKTIGQEFINQCFEAHGDLSKITGKKI